MPTDTTTAASPKTLNVNVTPASVDVEPGQTLVFTNHSQKFPTFQIEFEGGNSPASPGDILTGTNKIEIHVAEEGQFEYTILHFPETGAAPTSTGAFSIRSCSGGCH